MTALRRELGIGDETVVMYAGNVGFSQSLEMVVAAARAMPALTFRDQRRRRGEGIVGGRGRADCPTSASPAISPSTGWPRCWQPATSTSCRSKAGPRPRQRPVEDVLDPRRRPAGAGGDRSGHRGAANPGRVGRGSVRRARRPRRVPDGRCRRLADDTSGRQDMAVAGRRWVEHAASPAAVARGLRGPDCRAEPATADSVLIPGSQIASHLRGYVIIRQKSCQARLARQGQEGPLPGRLHFPNRRRSRRRAGTARHRLRPREPAERRIRRSPGQRRCQRRLALACRVRHLHLRHLPAEDRRQQGRDRRRLAGQHRAAQRRLPDPRRAQPRGRRHPLPPVLRPSRPATAPSSVCSSTCTTSSSPTPNW